MRLAPTIYSNEHKGSMDKSTGVINNWNANHQIESFW